MIKGYLNCDPLANIIRGPVFKYIVKYRNHPSILPRGEVYSKNRRLNFFLFTNTKTQNPEWHLKVGNFQSLPRHRYPHENRQ